MSATGTGSASQLSPGGHVFQFNYASTAMEKCGTVIGLRGRDGVVLAVEKILTSPLYEADAGERIFTVDESIGMAITGPLAVGRHVVDVARQKATKYRQQFQRTMPVKELCESLSGYMYNAETPLGVWAMLSAWDENQGPQLYQFGPSGVFFSFSACANGKAREAARAEMENVTYTDMPTEELVRNAGKIIYTVHDDLKDKYFRYEMSLVSRETEAIHCINPSPWIVMAIEAGQASCLKRK